MSSETTIHIPKLLSASGKTYHFNNDMLNITDSALKYFKKTIQKRQVVSLRFGIKWIRGRYFVIGRHFVIELKLDNDTIFPIKFSSYYGLKKNLYTERYLELINAVWSGFFRKDIIDIVARFNNGETLYISMVEFNQAGVSWDDKDVVPWDKVALSNYHSYFAIRHIDDAKHHKSLKFLNDWDAYLLQQTLMHILDQRAKQADSKFGVNLN